MILRITLIYLAIGVILFIAIALRVIKEFFDERPIARRTAAKWRLVMTGLLLTLAIITVWPLMISSELQKLRKRRHSSRYGEFLSDRRDLEIEDDELTFSSMGGAGEISCKNCNFSQEITSFIHGATSGPDAWCEAGMQCQRCGGFTTTSEKKELCECGGELSRDNLLFCPKCRSKRLSYEMFYIT